jgi:hypothetical protein
MALLRARRQRPSRCRAAAKQDDEFAPSHAGHGELLPQLVRRTLKPTTDVVAGPWDWPELF